ncbi:ABC transporter permease [Cesiribacter sp. SM1]|uniref:ABC transporter permease n=1 Tax=Cesiribacter sp. SM1 TaxID=2861196 RepID=UPI001CD59B96|nr:ABC transporter permease [Cesiribacter sp. SM1]
MFKHNFLLIYRNLLRFKSTFFINLVGLSTGLACALLIYLWVNDELQVDKFHEKDSQLFQVMLNHHNTGEIETAHATPALMAEVLKAEMPEVEHAVATTAGIEMPLFRLTVGEESFKAAGLFAGEEYFRLFSYNLIQGARDKVLAYKSSIVISEALARTLFGTTENIIGNSVQFGEDRQLQVSGVFTGTPPNSSDQFDFLVSFEIFKELMGPEHQDWGNTGPRTFVLLKEGTNVETFNSKISGFMKQKASGSNADVFVRPYTDKYLYDTYENGVQAGGRIEYVRLFSIIAIFVLLIACINFMNLSTARATRRLKEVGIKKTLGAYRKTLIVQYLGESMVMTVLSLLLALLLVVLLLPQFNLITGKQLSISFNLSLILSILGITLMTGLIAGSYPALYLSGFNPITALKGKLSSSAAEVFTRKGLVVFQFTLSIIFIVAVLVVYQQLDYVQTKNLGYHKEQIIYFEKEGRAAQDESLFLSEIKRIPGIVNAGSTSHSFLAQQTTTTGVHWEGKNPEDIIKFELAKVSYDMIETLGLHMAAGRAFSKDYGSDSLGIIFNEAAIETMGLDNPVGKYVNVWGKDRQIIGVTKDFHFQSLHEAVKPLFFIVKPTDTYKIMARVAAGREREAVTGLQQFYEEFNPGYTLDYKFLNQDYQALYAAENRVAILSKYFSGITIIVSCLGLFGLAAFTAERRRKEIGIRKVLGASQFSIVYLLSSDFTRLVGLAICIALPLSYLLVKNWLNGFEYRIELAWWYFIGAGLAALAIAWLTVGAQAVKAATSNPVRSLKDE